LPLGDRHLPGIPPRAELLEAPLQALQSPFLE
jgi:hypothetical protein